MPSFSTEIIVDAPPELVFDVFSDFPAYADMITDIDSIEMLTDPPVGLGTRYREVRTVAMKENTQTYEVVAFDPPHAFTLEARPEGGFCRIACSFVRQPDDSTIVIFSVSVEYESFSTKVFSSIMWPLMQTQLHAVIIQDLSELKAVAESYE